MAELILALDVPTAAAGMRVLDTISGLRWVKVGSVLMTREGAPFLRTLKERGLQVFLDLKWHDIPNTVAGAVSAARELGVTIATVHTLGGQDMMKAAAEAAGDTLSLVGVTVLTSHDDSSLAQILGKQATGAEAEVLRLAESARTAGLDGIVCSPLEVALVKKRWPAVELLVVPGIRGKSDAAGDQHRVATPAAAIAAGATHLVVGRPILNAADPNQAFQRFLREMA